MPINSRCSRNDVTFSAAKFNHMFFESEPDNADGFAFAPEGVNASHEITERQGLSPGVRFAVAG